METIHTDSAYRFQSSKDVEGAKIKMPLDQPASDSERKILRNSNSEDQISNLSREVTLSYALL